MAENKVKKDIITQFQINSEDTGSAEVQIALLTDRINRLNEHFKDHKQDTGSRRGLMMLVGRRRRLLDYLGRKDSEKYKEILQRLNLRK